MNTITAKPFTSVSKHLLYWVSFVLFFTVVWGTYDMDFQRNFLIQIFGLPAKILLVYLLLYYSIPVLLFKRKYIKFFCSYVFLLFLCGMLIQRPIMIYYVQPVYWPEWSSSSFFALTEIVNTILDVNLALILPAGYMFYRKWQSTNQKALDLEKQQEKIGEPQDFIYLKVEKSLEKILLKDIIYIESLKNYIKVKTANRTIVTYNSISSIAEELPKDQFIRVHRSYIVNINSVRSFSPKKIKFDTHEIPVGRTYKEQVKKKLGYF